MSAQNARRNRVGFYFIIPYFVVFIIFGLYPIIYSLYISFTNWNGFSSPVFVGLRNYTRLLHDTAFYQSILTTFTIWIISIVPQLILAMVLAIILNEKFLRGKHFFRAVFYLPNIVTPVTIGVLAALMFDWKTGSINKMLMALHLIHAPINWLGHPFLAQLIVGGIMCWQYFGYTMLIYTAGLQSIPDEVYEAAALDGASKFHIATKITMPMIRPVILFTVVTSVIGGMQIFDVPLMLGNTAGNSTQTMVTYLYTTGFKRFDYGYASAIAYGIFVLIMILSLITMRVTRTRNESATSKNTAPIQA